MISVEIDASRLEDSLNYLYDVYRNHGADKPLADLVRQQAALFSLSMVRYTPFITEKQGMAVVPRDIGYVGYFFNPEVYSAGNEKFRRRLWQLVRQARVDVINQILQKHTKEGGAFLASELPSKHAEKRNRFGRVRKQVSNPVIDPQAGNSGGGQYSAYVNRIKSHVGRFKASWLSIYAELGGKYKNMGKGLSAAAGHGWIKRHVPSPNKSVVDLSAQEGAPSITLINRNPGVAHQQRILEFVLKAREEAMYRQARLIANNWNKAVIEEGRKPSKGFFENIQAAYG